MIELASHHVETVQLVSLFVILTKTEAEVFYCTWYVGLMSSAPGGDEQKQQQKKQKGGDLRQMINNHGADGEHL